MGKLKEWTMKAKRNITYHGRSGKPTIHLTKVSLKPYIMVRKVGGGVKRLYIGSAKASKNITKGFKGLYNDSLRLAIRAGKSRRRK